MKLRHNDIRGNVSVAGATYDCSSGVVTVENDDHAQLLCELLGFVPVPPWEAEAIATTNNESDAELESDTGMEKVAVQGKRRTRKAG